MKTMDLLPPRETMYRALVNRDSSFEGIFYVGVCTTGVFCRPTCMAKKPARENVNFFGTLSEALHNGYRPCLRCRPMDPNGHPPELIERLRAEVERVPGIQATLRDDFSSLSPGASNRRRVARRAPGRAC